MGTVVELKDSLPNWAEVAVDNDPEGRPRAFRLDEIEETTE
jgi:hypothetical protein